MSDYTLLSETDNSISVLNFTSYEKIINYINALGIYFSVNEQTNFEDFKRMIFERESELDIIEDSNLYPLSNSRTKIVGILRSTCIQTTLYQETNPIGEKIVEDEAFYQARSSVSNTLPSIPRSFGGQQSVHSNVNNVSQSLQSSYSSQSPQSFQSSPNSLPMLQLPAISPSTLQQALYPYYHGNNK